MGTPADTLPWWKTAVFYQVYTRSFRDANGDGVGDLRGIIEKLDYLKGRDDSLGVDALWLNPFFPSPQRDFGYDITDYCGVDPLFGDLETFDTLVREAHARELKVVIDWVPNHTSSEHPWFAASRASREDPKRAWYVWRDPAPDGGPPNNWSSFFGGPAWTLDERTGQYYLHFFLPEQPDLNWRNPEVEHALFDVLTFWAARGIDGVRMDAVPLLVENETMVPDGAQQSHVAPDQFSEANRRDALDRTAHQQETFAILERARVLLDSCGEVCTIGEAWGDRARWVEYFGRGNRLHIPFNFELMEIPWDAARYKQAVEGLEQAVPADAWPNYVMGNHDRERLVSRLGGEFQARAAALMLLTLRGTPFIYYGEELGLANANPGTGSVHDPQARLGSAWNRDVARAPMPWNSTPHGGFTDGAEPWLALAEEYVTRNVATLSADPHSTFSLYRKLLALRRDREVLTRGAYVPYPMPHEHVFVYGRSYRTDHVVVAVNFSGETVSVELPPEGALTLLVSTYLDRQEPVGERLELRPFEGVVLTACL